MKTKVQKVQEIVTEAEKACARAVWAQVWPMIQKEFDRLHRLYPDFTAIRFGNGIHIFYFKEGTRFDNRNQQLPKAFNALDEMCGEVAYRYGGDDIFPSKTEG